MTCEDPGIDTPGYVYMFIHTEAQVIPSKMDDLKALGQDLKAFLLCLDSTTSVCTLCPLSSSASARPQVI